jgi:hypothetical protein
LIALFVSFSACFLVAYRGTDDYESSYKSEQNLGGEYRSTREPGIGVPSGIKRVLSVPVWDQTQGLGQRMPNLFAQQSQSPFVFLSRFVSIDFLVYLRLLICLSISLVLINLLVQTWGNWRLKLRLLVLDISLTGLFFLNSIHNDFHDESDQTWGIALLLAAVMHKSVLENSRKKIHEGSQLVYLSLIFGTSFLLTGHPTWFQIVFLGGGFLFIVNLGGLIGSLAKPKLLFVCAFALTLLSIQLVEAVKVDLKRSEYSVQDSIWDFFTELPRVYRLQEVMAPIAATFQPFLFFFNKAGSRTEFFNLALVFLLVHFVSKNKFNNSLSRELGKRVLGTAVFSVLCLMFSGFIGQSRIPVVSEVFRIHAWRLANVLFLLVTIAAAIVFGEIKYWGILKPKESKMVMAFAAVGVVTAILYPIVMLTKGVDNSQFSIFRDPRVESINERELVKTERFADLSVSSNDSESDWNSIFGTRFSMQLSRAGYPTIEFFGAARLSETLTAKSEPYRSGFVPNTADCRPEVLEFLAVSSIFVNTEDASGCREKLLAYFGEDSVREINKVAGPPGTASLFRPKSFSSWSIVMDSTENPTVSCPLLEQDCLRGLEVTELPATGGAPFRLCENDCLFTYKWARTENSKQILLPVNFDKTIEIKDSLTGERLKTANYQGLLAVQIDSDETSGVFTGDIRPDLMMWLRVAMTYLHTIVFVGALVALLVKGVRAVKEISKAPERQPVS